MLYGIETDQDGFPGNLGSDQATASDARRSILEDVLHGAGKISLLVRLTEHCQVASRRVLCRCDLGVVAGDQQDLYGWQPLPDMLGQLIARHSSWHHDIAKDEIHLGADVKESKRCWPIAGLDDPIAEQSQATQGKFAHLGIVLDDQYCLTRSGAFLFLVRIMNGLLSTNKWRRQIARAFACSTLRYDLLDQTIKLIC